MNQSLLYVYGVGEGGQRADGFRYAVATTMPDGGGTDHALFRDMADAHLFAHDKAARLRATTSPQMQVVVLPSAEPEPSRYGWPQIVVRADYLGLHRGDLAIMCPHCQSLDISVTLRPPGYGSGPGRTYRFGDPGATQYAKCNECGKSSDLDPKE